MRLASDAQVGASEEEGARNDDTKRPAWIVTNRIHGSPATVNDVRP